MFVLEYGVIKHELIAKVMKETDRGLYCRVAYPYVGEKKISEVFRRKL